MIIIKQSFCCTNRRSGNGKKKWWRKKMEMPERLRIFASVFRTDVCGLPGMPEEGGEVAHS